MTVTLDAGVSHFFVQLNKLQTQPGVPSAQVCREIFVQLHISAWDSKLTQQPMALRALTEFGLLSYFQYLTQSPQPNLRASLTSLTRLFLINPIYERGFKILLREGKGYIRNGGQICYQEHPKNLDIALEFF